MYYTVTKVEYLTEYKLLLTFNDGAVKAVDLNSRIQGRGGIFKELLDKDYFRQVRLTSESIEWPNGFDICPNLLYEIGTEVAKIA